MSGRTDTGGTHMGSADTSGTDTGGAMGLRSCG